MNGDGLGGRSAVSSIVSCSERPNDGVVACGIASGGFAGHFDRHLTAVVCGSGVVHRHLVRALNRVVGRHEGELRRRGVLNGDGLGGRGAVSRIVGGGERSNNGVVPDRIAVIHHTRF